MYLCSSYGTSVFLPRGSPVTEIMQEGAPEVSHLQWKMESLTVYVRLFTRIFKTKQNKQNRNKIRKIYRCGQCKMPELQINKVVDPEFFTDNTLCFLISWFTSLWLFKIYNNHVQMVNSAIPVLGCVHEVLCTTAHEQAQSNRAGNICNFVVLGFHQRCLCRVADEKSIPVHSVRNVIFPIRKDSSS